MFYPHERVALFIDGSNVHTTCRTLDASVDWKKLLAYFGRQCRLLHADYFTAMSDADEYNSLRPLIDWLHYNGFRMHTKPAKEYTDATGRRRLKGNIDVDIAVTMLESAAHLDHVVLLSGDGDFVPLVKAVQGKGLRVTVVSTVQTKPPMVSDDLRRQADVFLDLADMLPEVARPADLVPRRAWTAEDVA